MNLAFQNIRALSLPAQSKDTAALGQSLLLRGRVERVFLFWEMISSIAEGLPAVHSTGRLPATVSPLLHNGPARENGRRESKSRKGKGRMKSAKSGV